MYKINKTTNNVVRLEQRLFKGLKIKERDHLQEWIAKNPEVNEEEKAQLQGRFNDELYWETLTEWYAIQMKNFYMTFNPVWEKVQKDLN